MLLAIAAIALPFAVALLLAGLRSRRVDDHPLCRRCRYDLTGSTGERCPECGADTSRPRAIRVGHRVRRPGPLVAGLALTLPAVAVLGTRGVAAARQLRHPANQPVWWLRHELNGTAIDRDPALAELTDRRHRGRLTTGQLDSVVDSLLAAQATVAPWDLSLGQFVEDAHTDGQIDPARWTRFARQSFPVTLVVRPTVRQGDPLPVRIAFDPTRADNNPFEASITGSVLRIDGRPTRPTACDTPTVWATYGEPNRPVTPVTLFVSYAPCPDSTVPEPTGNDTRLLTPGRHTLSATVRVNIFDGNIPAGDGAPRGGALPDASRALVVFDRPLSATVTVYDATHEPPLTVVDPDRRTAMAAAVAASGVTVAADGHVWVDAKVVSVPIRVAFTVSVRPAGGGPELTSDGSEVAQLSVSAGRSNNAFVNVNGVLGPAGRADVIFRPHSQGLRDGTDATPIWGQPVVVRDVPVTRPH